MFHNLILNNNKEHHRQIKVQKNACLEVMFFFVYNQKTKELRNFEVSEKEMEHMNSIYKKLKTIKFEIKPSKIYVFDKESEERLDV